MTEDMKNKGEYSELEVVNVRLVKEPSMISETPVRTSEDATQLIRICFRNLTERYSAS